MTQLAQPTQTRPIVIGGIYEYTKLFGETGKLVVEGFSNDFVRAWLLDDNQQNTSIHVSYSPSMIGKQVGYDITYSPTYQALQDRLDHLSKVKQANQLINKYLIEQNLPTQSNNDISLSISIDIALVEQEMDKLKASCQSASAQSTFPKTFPIDPINTGLSPLWRADRCVIPVADKPKSKWQGFVGRKINILYFAQECTIEEVFTKYGHEWAKLTHPQHGTITRYTKDLLVKDIVC